MKIHVLLSLVAAVAYANTIKEKQKSTAYAYIQNIGIPLAKKILEAETKAIKAGSDGKNRIIGGSPATLAKIPYQVGLLGSYVGFNGRGVCGGSLVTADRVISAAHCWFDGVNQANQFEVVLGSVTLFNGGTRMTSTSVLHPDWDPSNIRSDVVVIYLPNSVTFSDTISPVSLPLDCELKESFSGETAIASGYGLTSDKGSISTGQSLSFVKLNIMPNSICRIAFPVYLTDNNICTSSFGNVSTCRGDSGGPLVVVRNNRNVLVGITSFGSSLGCELSFPAAFTRVSSFIDFLNANL